MRVILILLGLLLMLGGGAVAGAQYAPPDLLKMLDSAPAQARDFLQTPTALYAGAGGAGSAQSNAAEGVFAPRQITLHVVSGDSRFESESQLLEVLRSDPVYRCFSGGEALAGEEFIFG